MPLPTGGPYQPHVRHIYRHDLHRCCLQAHHLLSCAMNLSFTPLRHLSSNPVQSHRRRSRAPRRRRLIAQPAAILAVLAAGVALLPLGLLAGISYPGAPPSPGRIVYTRANEKFIFDVYTSDADGENEFQLTNTDDAKVYGNGRGEGSPRWSADGRQVVFTSADRKGLISVWRVPFSGGTPTPIVQGDGEAGDPDWQPGGDCIAYSGAHVGGRSTLDLKIKCLDGTERTIRNTADVDERGPDWAPDGNLIVYEARTPPKSFSDIQHWSLRTVRPDGTDDQLLFEWPGTSLRYPRWSPDGTRIAFVAGHPEGLGTLYVLELGTRSLAPLVQRVASQVAWSPDGTRILFYGTGDEGPQPQVASPAAPLLASQALLPGSLSATGLAEWPPGGGEAPAQEQLLGLYVIDVADKTIYRLRGPAGGTGAKSDSFQWGYSPDWTAGTATATPTPSLTPTPTATPTATATATATPTPTRLIGNVNYLPALYRSYTLPDDESAL